MRPGPAVPAVVTLAATAVAVFGMPQRPPAIWNVRACPLSSGAPAWVSTIRQRAAE